MVSMMKGGGDEAWGVGFEEFVFEEGFVKGKGERVNRGWG